MLKEFNGHVFVNGIIKCKFHGNPHHIERKHRHPTCTVRLFQVVTVFKLHVSVECANIIESQKTSAKYVVSLFVFTVYPPGKIEKQFLKNTFKERNVGLPIYFFINLINAEGRPGMNRRINVAEVPFIGR